MKKNTNTEKNFRPRFTLTYDDDFQSLLESYIMYLKEKDQNFITEHKMKEPDIMRMALLRVMQQDGFFKHLEKFNPELYKKSQERVPKTKVKEEGES